MGSFSIAIGGKIVYQRAFGYASLSPKVQANTGTTYPVGSISKTFTATIILQMVHEGKLSLQDKLSQFFPAWPKADEMTIEHLLRHRSGIHNFGEDQRYRNVDPETREEMVQLFEEAKTDFRPGSRAKYNNANYVVLSLIAEKVNSMSFAEVLQTRITHPLQLRNTYCGSSQPKEHEAQAYYWQSGWQQAPAGDPTTLMGAGAIVTTPADLNMFLHALFSYRFFPQELLGEMMTFEDGYGLGLFRYPFGNRTCYGHAGSIGAYSAMAAYFPEEEISFALCLNGTRLPLNNLLVQALRLWFGE